MKSYIPTFKDFINEKWMDYVEDATPTDVKKVENFLKNAEYLEKEDYYKVTSGNDELHITLGEDLVKIFNGGGSVFYGDVFVTYKEFIKNWMPKIKI
jgi:hypothetical protein